MARVLEWESGRYKKIRDTDEPEDLPPSHAEELRLKKMRNQTRLYRDQLFAGLVDRGIITAIAAKSANTTVPLNIEAAILSVVPSDRRDQQRLKWLHATEIRRLGLMNDVLAELTSPAMTDEELDQFFEDYKGI